MQETIVPNRLVEYPSNTYTGQVSEGSWLGWYVRSASVDASSQGRSVGTRQVVKLVIHAAINVEIASVDSCEYSVVS